MTRWLGRLKFVGFLLIVGCGSDSAGDDDATGGDATGANGPSAGADAASAVDTSGPTALSGTIGALGAIQPIVSSKVISNSGETLVYMTTAPLSCEQLAMSRWLGGFTKDAQVIEIVVSGAAKIGPGKKTEVNYAAGGKSSSYEKGAATASVTFTKAEPMGVVEGTVTATYAMGNLTGTFHAEFCPNGQGY
jgi:hypothetical protein